MTSSTTQTKTPGTIRDPGSILLVSCYELGHQPIGLAQPMGFLEQAGFSPASLDLSVEHLDEQRIRAALLIGISVPMHTALTLGVQFAKNARLLNPSTHICFFGLYASLNAEYLLENTANSVIGGEYETPLLALVKRLDCQNFAPSQKPIPSFPQQDLREEIQKIPGVSIAGHVSVPFIDRLLHHPVSHHPPHAETLGFPIPLRTTLPSLDQYAKLDYRGIHQSVGYVEGSRGCLHQCLHCPIVPVYEGRFFIVPQEVVLADIQQHVDAAATHITFGDPDFFNGPGHSMSILRGMHQQFPNLTFDFTTKIEHILKHRTLFPELRDLGCLFVISAVESFSDTVLQHLEKGHTREDVFAALHIVSSAGISLRPSLVAFTPWTTMNDYIEMFTIIDSYNLLDSVDPIQYAVRLLIPPGSALLSPPTMHAQPIRQFIHQLDQSKFQYLWKHPDPRMDILYQTVAHTIEHDTKSDTDPFLTFHRLKTIAHEAAGLSSPNQSGTLARRNPNQIKPPRMTEPWFCCAEPTQDQLQPFNISHQSH